MNIVKKMDFILLGAVLGLVIVGLVALYSSSHTAMAQGTGTNYFAKQLAWASMGFILAFIVYFLPHRWIYESAYVLYGISVILLLFVLFFGSTGYGAERWLRLGPVKLQPSEFAKLSTILALARYLSDDRIDLNRVKDFLIGALIVFVPFALIIKEPDLGTSLVFAAMALPMFYWAGLKGTNLLLIVAPVFVLFASFHFYAFLSLMILLVGYLIYFRRSNFVLILNFISNIVVGLITPFLWNHLKPYQQNRIKIFLNPESDPRGAGYQIIQSKVAIGSGGADGKGFMHGSQTQLRFLPEQHTDFIFAVIGEEFGLLGVTIGLLLFLVLLLRGVKIASLIKNRFNSIVAIGIVTVIAFHAIINIGMTIGLLPVTGLPLPFVSYGGSAMLTNLVMVGVLLNYYKNRFEY